MREIRRVFTYNLADDYLAQTDNLKKSAQWTYVGADKIWVFIDDETNKLVDHVIYTERDNGADIPTPPGQTKICIDCNTDPLICTLIGASEDVDAATLPQYTEDLPNGEVYQRPRDPMPDHTYEMNDAVYNRQTGDWTLPWKKTWVTWEDIRRVRDQKLEEVENELRNVSDFPASIQTALTQYKQDLENIETVWAGVDAYKVWMPIHPIKG